MEFVENFLLQFPEWRRSKEKEERRGRRGHSARRCDCRADGNLSWVDAPVIRLLFLVFPGAIHLVVFNPDEMRMQFRRDAADQRSEVAGRMGRFLAFVKWFGSEGRDTKHFHLDSFVITVKLRESQSQ
jgi:hypothetical protein